MNDSNLSKALSPSRFRSHALTFGLLTCLVATGKAQVPTSWKSVGIGGGGAFFAPTFSPFNTREMWLACDMSGKYHSTNSGASWSLVPFTALQTGPNSPQVQYTSDKNTFYDVDTTGGNMTPVKTTNGGTNWAPLSNDPTGQGAWYLVADPTTTNRLFVSSYSTLYFSQNSGQSWDTVVALLTRSLPIHSANPCVSSSIQTNLAKFG